MNIYKFIKVWNLFENLLYLEADNNKLKTNLEKESLKLRSGPKNLISNNNSYFVLKNVMKKLLIEKKILV